MPRTRVMESMYERAMPPRAELPQDLGILAGRVFHADSGVRTNSHVLEVAVIQNREGLTVTHAEQQDQATEQAGLDTVLLLRAGTVVLLLVQHV